MRTHAQPAAQPTIPQAHQSTNTSPCQPTKRTSLPTKSLFLFPALYFSQALLTKSGITFFMVPLPQRHRKTKTLLFACSKRYFSKRYFGNLTLLFCFYGAVAPTAP
jgi:hypothetical protein